MCIDTTILTCTHVNEPKQPLISATYLLQLKSQLTPVPFDWLPSHIYCCPRQVAIQLLSLQCTLVLAVSLVCLFPSRDMDACGYQAASRVFLLVKNSKTPNTKFYTALNISTITLPPNTVDHTIENILILFW